MFRVYFHDESVFSGDRPEDVPTNKWVQAIAWDDPVRGERAIGRYVLTEYDFYIYSDGVGWHGTDKYSDLLNHLMKGCGPGGVRAVLQGQWIDRQTFFAIRDRAYNDPGLNVKSAVDKSESGDK